MLRALMDFFQQASLSPSHANSLITWVEGDGSLFLPVNMKYTATMYDAEDGESDYKNLHNIMSTIGIWHTQATIQNSIAANHYGPPVTDDPSALS